MTASDALLAQLRTLRDEARDTADALTARARDAYREALESPACQSYVEAERQVVAARVAHANAVHAYEEECRRVAATPAPATTTTTTLEPSHADV